MALTPGTRVGSYEITAQIGVGGMGEVYRATDSHLKRSVAIKVLPASVVGDADRLARFQREAEVLASLNHPNIAAIYGFEKSGGTHALVMELVEGEDLSQRIARGAVPIDEALPIARQIAEALEAAHEQGIIHRDLKPANIKVRPDGTAKVLDFGLAKAMESAPGTDTGVAASHLPTVTSPALMTGAGVILGTAAYMSPEQAKGRPADRRSDLWSFGCVLYEVLTGVRPFGGEDVADTLAAVLRAEVEWARLPASTAPHVVRLLHLCLTRDPHQRLQSAGDARIRLTEANDFLAPVERTPPASRRAVRAWQAAAVALAALCAGLLATSLRPSPVEVGRETRTSIATPSMADPNSFAISPDGRQVAFVASDSGVAKLWLRSLSATEARVLPGTERALYPFWSPDSRSLAFFADRSLRRLDLGDGRVRTLASQIHMRGGSWSADGTILVGRVTGALARLSSSGGEMTPVTGLAAGHSAHRWPAFLPDGRHFVFFIVGSSDVQGAYLASLDDPRFTRLVNTDAALTYLPGGRVAWSRGSDLVVQRLNLAERRLEGDVVTIVDHLTYFGIVSAPVVSASATGELVYQPGNVATHQLQWFSPDGRQGEVLGPPDESLSFPRVLPDGSRAVVLRSVEGNSDVWLVDGVRMVRVTSGPGREQFPIWSPDGARVVFRSAGAVAFDLFAKPVASADQTLLWQSDHDKTPQSWSADGRYLLFNQIDPATGWDVWALSVSERRAWPLVKTPSDERAGISSPDGRWIAYQVDDGSDSEVFISPFVVGEAAQPYRDPPRWQVSNGGGLFPVWRRDAAAVFYQAPDGRVMTVPVQMSEQDVTVGAPAMVFHPDVYGTLDVSVGRQWDLTRDGRFLVNVIREVPGSLTVIQNWRPPDGR